MQLATFTKKSRKITTVHLLNIMDLDLGLTNCDHSIIEHVSSIKLKKK